MNLQPLPRRLAAAPTVCPDEEVSRCCQRAKELEEVGDYEAAAGALGGHWSGVGVRPLGDARGPGAAAELLLRAGVLSGWIGSAA